MGEGFGKKLGRKAMQSLLAASILAATTGKVEGAPKGPKKQPQTSSWQAPKSPETSSWRTEIYDKDDIRTLLKSKTSEVVTRLRNYQLRVRLPDPPDQSGLMLRYLEDRPVTSFSMLDEKIQKEIRTVTNNRNVWLHTANNKLVGTVAGKYHDRKKELIRTSALPETGGGQGTPVKYGGKLYLATNAHVIGILDVRREYRNRAKALKGRDLAYYEVTEEDLRNMGVNMNYVVDLDQPLPEGIQLQGAPIFSRAFDPDVRIRRVDPKIPGRTMPEHQQPLLYAPVSSDGHKEFFGIATRTKWREQVYPSKENADHYAHGYDYRLPISEWHLRKAGDIRGKRIWGESRQARAFDAQGISGGAVDTVFNGKVYWVGMNVAVLPNTIQFPKTEQQAEHEAHFASMIFYDRNTVIEGLKDTNRIFKFRATNTTAQAKM